MNQVNAIKEDKHHVVINERIFQRIISKAKYNETFDQCLQRLLSEGKTTKEIFQED